MLATRQDPEILDLLATVHYEMRDLPAAGALWFATGRDDETARLAIAAWRERFGNEEARWQSLPSRVRQTPTDKQVRELQRAAKHAAEARWERQRSEWRVLHKPTWGDRLAAVGGIAFVVWVIVMTVIGFGTVMVWIWK